MWAYLAIMAFKLHSGLQQGSMIRAQGELNRKITMMNAEWAMRDAYEAERAGYSQSARYKAKENAVISEQVAQYEAAGIETEGTSAQELIKDTQTTAMLNVIDIQRQARANAMKYKVEASNIRLRGYTQQLEGRLQAAASQNAAIMDTLNMGLSGYSSGAFGGGQ